MSTPRNATDRTKRSMVMMSRTTTSRMMISKTRMTNRMKKEK